MLDHHKGFIRLSFLFSVSTICLYSTRDDVLKRVSSSDRGKHGQVLPNPGRALTTLFLLNTGFSLSMESVNALFPLYVQSLGASIPEVGFLLTASGLLSTSLMLFTGYMCDKFGRKSTMFLSVILACFPPLLYTFTTDWRQLIPWTMIFSASFAVFIPARMVYIADCTTSEDRTKIYGYMNIALPIGHFIGPMVAGILANSWGFYHPFYFATAVSLLCLVPASLVVEPRTLRDSLSSDSSTRKSYTNGFSRKAICILAILTLYQFLVSLGIGTSYSLLSIYLESTFLADELHVGLFFSLTGLALFPSQIIGGSASSRFGLRKFMILCLTFIPFLCVACASATNYELFTLTYVLLYALYSMTWPASVAILMNIVERSKWGLATGMRQTGVRLGFTVGPTLGAILWNVYGATTPFWASAILIAASSLLLLLLREE